MNSSQTNSYLQASNLVLEGVVYEDFMQQFLGGMTGLAPEDVFLQTSVRDEIEATPDKLLFYLEQSWGDDAPHLDNGDENAVFLTRNFTDVWHLAFRGVNHWQNAQRFEDAVHVYQNRYGLRQFGLGIKEIGVVEKEKDERFQLQTKIQLALLREIKRRYEICNFGAVDCELDRAYKNSV